MRLLDDDCLYGIEIDITTNTDKYWQLDKRTSLLSTSFVCRSGCYKLTVCISAGAAKSA